MKKKKTINYNKKRKRKKIRGFIAFSLLAAFGIWFSALQLPQVTSDTVAYDFAVPYKRRNLSNYITVSGRVEMRDKDIISTDVKRPVSKICCELGEYVKKGDILCEFSSEALDEQKGIYNEMLDDANELEKIQKDFSALSISLAKQQNEVRLLQAEKNRDFAYDAYDSAQEKADEYRELADKCDDEAKKLLYESMYKSFDEQLSSLQEAKDTADQIYNDLNYEVDKFTEQIKSNNYITSFDKPADEEFIEHINKIDEEASKSVVKAERDGIISDIYVSEGDYAYSGMLFGIGCIDKYVVKANIRPRDILDVHEGNEVEFTTKLTGDKIIKGKVSSVSQVFNGIGYEVEIEICDNETEIQLRPNIDAITNIYIIKSDDKFAVQYDSVIEENGEQYVFRAIPDGSKYTAEKIKVKTGLESDYYVEILESELKEGDMILGNSQRYSDGQTVRIRG